MSLAPGAAGAPRGDPGGPRPAPRAREGYAFPLL